MVPLINIYIESDYLLSYVKKQFTSGPDVQQVFF